jgi:hypothetical protein
VEVLAQGALLVIMQYTWMLLLLTVVVYVLEVVGPKVMIGLPADNL